MNKNKKSPRKKLYALHTWVGFHLAIIMTLVLFTGALATVSNEIDWLIHPEMRVSPGHQKVSWGTMEAAIQAYRPGEKILSLSAMSNDYFAYRARMVNEYGRHYFLYVDQWSGQVTGASNIITFQRFFRDIHRYLFMPNFIGLPLVTSLSFILAISLYTGLKTTRKWGTVATRIRTDKGLRVAVGDIHKSFGVWASWFFVVMIVTGLWYLAEFGAAVAGNRFDPARPGVGEVRVERFGAVIRDADTNEYIAAAKAAYPEFEPTVILYPRTAQDAVMVQGRNNNILLRDRANSVFLDPVDLRIIKVQRASGMDWVAYLNQMADPLHFGNFGGLATKFIWFIFGLAMAVLSVSGVWLTWRRLNTARISKAQLATMPIMLAMMVFSVFWYQRMQGPLQPEAEQHLPVQKESGFESRIAVIVDNKQQPTGLLRVVISTPEGRPNVGTLSVSAGTAKDTVEMSRKMLGKSTAVRVSLPKSALNAENSIRLDLMFNSGEELSYIWPLAALDKRELSQK